MADRNRNRRPYLPVNRRNKFSSSFSDSSKSHNPNHLKPSNPDSNSTRVTSTKKPTTGNWNSDDDTSRNDTDEFPTLVGTCPFMCPVEEMERRERLRDLAVFERLHGNPVKTAPNLAVKKFCRTISSKDVKASDVRPVSVLEDTLNYLLKLLHSNDHPFEVVHDFIFDRTRSIRQDLTMQNAASDQVIDMYERMVRFHIISYHHLHRRFGTPYAASMSHLNVEQLVKALTTLFNLYEANRASETMSLNEAEFFSFYILLHLGSENQVEPLSLWLRSVPSRIMKSKEMCFARSMLRYYRMGNYKRFICTTEAEASFLQYCIIEPYINKVRTLALSCVSYGSYKLQPYPLVHLSKLLMMKESDIGSLCVDCSLETSDDGAGKALLSTKQSVDGKTANRLQKYYSVDSERIERLCAEQSEL